MNGLRKPTAQIARFAPEVEPAIPGNVVGLSDGMVPSELMRRNFPKRLLNDCAFATVNRPHNILHAILDAFSMRKLSRRFPTIHLVLSTSLAFAPDNSIVQIMGVIWCTR